MEQNTHTRRSIINIFIKIFSLIIFLGIGLYFGIRLGEGYYNFYQPNSPIIKMPFLKQAMIVITPAGTMVIAPALILSPIESTRVLIIKVGTMVITLAMTKINRSVMNMTLVIL